MIKPGKLDWDEGELVAVCATCRDQEKLGTRSRNEAIYFLHQALGWTHAWLPVEGDRLHPLWVCPACKRFLAACGVEGRLG